jgi:hypothetical protein
MKKWIVGGMVALGLLGAAMQAFSPSTRRRRRARVDVESIRLSTDQEAAAALIRGEVDTLRGELDDFERSLLVQAVLAWSRGESGLGRALQGDLRWAFEHPNAYRRRVLEEPAYAQNPFRTDRSAWTSYGLFHQLAADWFKVAIARGLAAVDDHPSVLAAPGVSAKLGVPMVLALLAVEREHEWPEAFIRARLAAKGCGSDGSRCAAATVARARANAERVLREFQVFDLGPTPDTLGFEGVA